MKGNQKSLGELDETANNFEIKELKSRNIQLEQALQQRDEELRSAHKELDCLAYAISHDLRAPLRGLDGLILALHEDCADTLDRLGKEYLEQISATGKHLTRLVDALLELSRSTRVPLRSQKLNISIIAENIARQLKERDPQRSVEIKIDQEICHQGDEALVTIALYKLFDNAWKFTSGRQSARIELKCNHEEDQTIFLLRDNGAGFNMDYADKLFGPFQRLHAADEFPGIGIGLAIAQRIVSRHGGRIWAESKSDQGTTFYFTLSA